MAQGLRGGRRIERPTLRGLLDELEEIFRPDAQPPARGPPSDHRVRPRYAEQARVYSLLARRQGPLPL